MVKLQSGIQLLKRRKYDIKTTIHENAFAVSGERTIYEKDLNEIRDIIVDEFTALNQWIPENGGIIGHIKGFLSAKKDSVMISTTGDEIYCHMQKSDKTDKGIKVSIVVIVYYISQTELEKRIISLLDNLLEP